MKISSKNAQGADESASTIFIVKDLRNRKLRLFKVFDFKRRKHKSSPVVGAPAVPVVKSSLTLTKHSFWLRWVINMKITPIDSSAHCPFFHHFSSFWDLGNQFFERKKFRVSVSLYKVLSQLVLYPLAIPKSWILADALQLCFWDGFSVFNAVLTEIDLSALSTEKTHESQKKRSWTLTSRQQFQLVI